MREDEVRCSAATSDEAVNDTDTGFSSCQGKRIHKKKMVKAVSSLESREGGGMRGKGLGQKKDLPPDAYDKYSCVVCLHPKAPLVPGGKPGKPLISVLWDLLTA